MDANKLFYGDNLEIMREHMRDESVDLCYIDPPFNSKRNYNQIYNGEGREDAAQSMAFIDTWTWNDAAQWGIEEILDDEEQRYTNQTIALIRGLKEVLGETPMLAYIVSMTQRINEIHRILKPTGSFYLHCDPTMSHYLKLVLDSIFCPQGGDFLNEITWKRYAVHSLAGQRFDAINDTIFFYTKIFGRNIFNTQYGVLSKDEEKKNFRIKKMKAAGGFNMQA